MKWLDEISYLVLIGIAVLMALLPFQPEPHLTEKLKMLADGTLAKPLDIFDLFWHLLPCILLIVKFVRSRKQSDA
ncbi:hypothetical protein F3F96_10730 [Mariprofundus sp. NF]|jgi:hypothetical protein|uniref:hypothetical protein n=1 Tax=Mariprofundus sp. NF TaxID=2608716 RepID=UPI0015A4DAD0|nr:hypothetical protein [Mariprofundus sp. NF]NWF39609.1 hypothetical protein [Mariprofundus sp. NF]